MFPEISGGPAWIVGSELGGLTLNIVARGNPGKSKNPELDEDDLPDCPVEMKGAYDRVSLTYGTSNNDVTSWKFFLTKE